MKRAEARETRRRVNEMNEESGRERHVDPVVSAQLKAIADEVAPDELDQVVLREARRALRADNRRGSFAAWFRPLAFAATIGLSLAIILEFSETGILAPASDPGSVTPPAARARGQANLDELKRQEKSPGMPAPTDSPLGERGDTRGDEDADFVSPAAARSSKLKRELLPETDAAAGEVFDAAASSAMQGLQEAEADRLSTLSLDPARETRDVAPQAAAPAALPTACDERQTSAPESWWACIESLRRAGQSTAADRETDALKTAFPDFELPL